MIWLQVADTRHHTWFKYLSKTYCIKAEKPVCSGMLHTRYDLPVFCRHMKYLFQAYYTRPFFCCCFYLQTYFITSGVPVCPIILCQIRFVCVLKKYSITDITPDVRLFQACYIRCDSPICCRHIAHLFLAYYARLCCRHIWSLLIYLSVPTYYTRYDLPVCHRQTVLHHSWCTCLSRHITSDAISCLLQTYYIRG